MDAIVTDARKQLKAGWEDAEREGVEELTTFVQDVVSSAENEIPEGYQDAVQLYDDVVRVNGEKKLGIFWTYKH